METEGKTVFHHPPRVVSFGEILFDVIEGVPCLGGAPLNLAVHLHRQGAETTLISAVGADPLGRSALKQIQEFENRRCGSARPHLPDGARRMARIHRRHEGGRLRHRQAVSGIDEG